MLPLTQLVLLTRNVRSFAHGVTRRAESHLDKEETVLAFDLGGGTLDLSLIESKARHLKVLRTGGNMHLGGQDFDQRIVDWLVAVSAKPVYSAHARAPRTLHATPVTLRLDACWSV